jgi:hypothetical protein
MKTFTLFCLDGYLADSLTYDFKPRPLLTPNGYIAFDVDFPLGDDLKRRMVELAREQLAGQAGVKSLARRDWKGVLSPEFLAAPGSVVDGHLESVGLYNYHRGVEWLWLNQFMVEGELACGDPETAYSLYLQGQVHSALHEGGVGGLSELYDVRGPLGADFQAWSMAGFVASLHAFGGVEVDALHQRVRVRPNPPKAWAAYCCRRQVGQTRFDVATELEASGARTVRINPLDRIPDGYTLSIAVPVPHGAGQIEAQVNGKTVPATRATTCNPQIDDAEVEVPFTGEVCAAIRARSP